MTAAVNIGGLVISIGSHEIVWSAVRSRNGDDCNGWREIDALMLTRRGASPDPGPEYLLLGRLIRRNGEIDWRFVPARPALRWGRKAARIPRTDLRSAKSAVEFAAKSHPLWPPDEFAS